MKKKINLYKATYNFDSVLGVWDFPTISVTKSHLKKKKLYVYYEAKEKFNPRNIKILKTSTHDGLTVPDVKNILKNCAYKNAQECGEVSVLVKSQDFKN